MIIVGFGLDNVNYLMYECGSGVMSQVLWASEAVSECRRMARVYGREEVR